MKPTNPVIWALTDGRPGNDNQVIAVASAIGDYENKRIKFSSSASLHNFLLGTSDLGILTKLDAPWPDIVIGAGRKLARVARIIKKESPQTKIIQLMWPGIGARDFDLIFTPEHDNLKPHKNLITTIGAPNMMTPERLKASAEKWQPRIPIDSRPAIAVLIGNITLKEATELVNILNLTTGYPMITTSRRTKPEVTEYIKNHLSVERYLHEWAPNAENPYLGFVALADFIIVTNDSVSMNGEALTTGKPVYIFRNKVVKRHVQFFNSLISQGYARELKDENLETYTYPPLNTLDYVVTKIREKIEN